MRISDWSSDLCSSDLGDFELVNPIASFPDYDTVLYDPYGVQRNGNIGNEVLKRFNVIFDYRHTVMYLKPNNRFGDPFEHDMSGMSLVTGGNVYRRYFITNIIPGSPADDAGLEVDDEILSINLQPAKEMSISEIDRSEEHTSELQSLMRTSSAVLCLK